MHCMLAKLVTLMTSCGKTSSNYLPPMGLDEVVWVRELDVHWECLLVLYMRYVARPKMHAVCII